jgi:uncharacterized membrane protein (DUF2068 family)
VVHGQGDAHYPKLSPDQHDQSERIRQKWNTTHMSDVLMPCGAISLLPPIPLYYQSETGFNSALCFYRFFVRSHLCDLAFFRASPMVDRQSKFLPLIACFKICKACMLFTLAFGLHHLRVGDSQNILTDWMRDIRVDPDDHYVRVAISKITGISTHRLHELGIFTFFYAVLFGTEGFGLLFKQRWAEYLTIVSTITFLPLEVYELVATPHRKWFKAALLIINVAILVYLIAVLRRKKRIEKSDPPEQPIGVLSNVNGGKANGAGKR